MGKKTDQVNETNDLFNKINITIFIRMNKVIS